jgi:hypothetical protein
MVPLSSLTSIPAVKLYNGIGYLLIWENSEDQNTFCNPFYYIPNQKELRANADRFTNIPKNRQKRRPTNLTKKGIPYWKTRC